MNPIKIFFTYKINDKTLARIKLKGIPEDLILKLTRIKGNIYSNKAQFIDELRKDIETNSLSEYQNKIVREARLFQLYRANDYLLGLVQTFMAESKFIPSMLKSFLLRPFPFTLWFRGRYYWFSLKAMLSRKPLIREIMNDNNSGFDYNKKQMLSFLRSHREQTEGFINIIRSIRSVSVTTDKLLCIGPRNESEVLLLNLYGFKLANISTIDLFSYSPLISVMDMNEMSYPDNTFDIYYSSAVIKYSPDLNKTISESIRVVKPGGLIAIGFTYGQQGEIIPKSAELMGGTKELISLYKESVDEVIWLEDHFISDDNTMGSVIFRLKK